MMRIVNVTDLDDKSEIDLVEWRGCGPESCTWELLICIRDWLWTGLRAIRVSRASPCTSGSRAPWDRIRHLFVGFVTPLTSGLNFG